MVTIDGARYEYQADKILKLQMFENLTFVQNAKDLNRLNCSSRNFGKYPASVGIIKEGKIFGR
jgi:hypothetical protein